MKYKVVVKTIETRKNDKGQDEHLMIPRKGNNVFGYVSCYETKHSAIGEGLSFEEAKKLRNQNKGSMIVRENEI